MRAYSLPFAIHQLRFFFIIRYALYYFDLRCCRFFFICSMFSSISFTSHFFSLTHINKTLTSDPLCVRCYFRILAKCFSVFFSLCQTNNFSSAHAHTIHDMLHTLPYFMCVWLVFFCYCPLVTILSHRNNVYNTATYIPI